MSTIIYTHTDEAPMLTTGSLLPLVQAFASTAGVVIQTSDISLSSRILAVFNDLLPEEQRVDDALAELVTLVKTDDANIIKLPSISATVPQLKAAIAELQSDGYALPAYPDEPKSAAEKATYARYDSVKGSAVNPLLREGNSDRRAPQSVKNFAKKHPHTMGSWRADSKTNVATMDEGAFFHSEKSVVIPEDDTLRIEFVASTGEVTVLKGDIKVLAREIVDAAFMSVQALDEFLNAQIERAKSEGVLFSAHLKATMMKVSDPVIFGHVVKAYFPSLFERYGAELDAAGLSANDGLAAILSGLALLDAKVAEGVLAEIEVAYATGPDLAMTNSDKGMTNLHAPSGVIVDASMPAMIRTSGRMKNKDNQEQDTLAVLPDPSYAGVYQAVLDDCRAHGAFDPTSMGTVPNVGLMAQKAEEYGSHDKTFILEDAGTVQIVDGSGAVLIEHEVQVGDIWRACQTKDVPVRDWVKLAVTRARASQTPAVFWLDENRAHDANIIAKVIEYLAEHDGEGLQIEIMAPAKATAFTLERIRRGEDTVSVSGNVLRDYLTDLFPILELGTSAKMLSIVPLINGGVLFETGAGGSAPKHVHQFLKENHLRWDSLSVFLALAASFEHEALAHGNARVQVLANTLDRATGTFLQEGRSPSRQVGEIDNRGSHFYMAVYWAQELAKQTDDTELSASFIDISGQLAQNEQKILDELNSVQGAPVDIKGYYNPSMVKVSETMRPSTTLNRIMETLLAR